MSNPIDGIRMVYILCVNFSISNFYTHGQQSWIFDGKLRVIQNILEVRFLYCKYAQNNMCEHKNLKGSDTSKLSAYYLLCHRAMDVSSHVLVVQIFFHCAAVFTKVSHSNYQSYRAHNTQTSMISLMVYYPKRND